MALISGTEPTLGFRFVPGILDAPFEDELLGSVHFPPKSPSAPTGDKHAANRMQGAHRSVDQAYHCSNSFSDWIHRKSRTSIPKSVSRQARSAVTAGIRSRSARARQQRSPKERPLTFV